jgi:quercetin dioxygenase-like cupin family protein
MSIDFTDISEIKKVVKPWGYEIWLANGSPNFKYALKQIFFKSKYKTSIQFHEFKEETTYVKEGKGLFYYSTTKIDLKRFKKNDYSQNELNEIIANFKTKELNPGVIIHIKPGIVHRVESIDNLMTIEVSTIELDDVYRLNDEWNRSDGKIDHEINY